MRPFIPPPASELEAATGEAITAWSAALANPGPWLKSHAPEVLGIGVIIAAQFPDVPASVLGRILASASMALSSVCMASERTGYPLTPQDLADYLGYAGARLAASGGEMTAAQDAPPSFTCPCCGAVSYSPDDIDGSYCGRCHWQTGDPLLGPPHLAGPCPERTVT